MFFDFSINLVINRCSKFKFDSMQVSYWISSYERFLHGASDDKSKFSGNLLIIIKVYGIIPLKHLEKHTIIL